MVAVDVFKALTLSTLWDFTVEYVDFETQKGDKQSPKTIKAALGGFY